MVRLPVLIVIFLLFFLPILVIPNPFSYFEIPKVIIAEIMVEILMLLILWKRRADLIKGIDKRIFFITLLVIIQTLLTLFFLSTPTTFFGNQFRLQGVFLLWHLLLWAGISSMISIPSTYQKYSLLSLILLLLGASILGYNLNGRLVGTLGEPNALAATAIYIWPFAWFIFKEKPLKILSLAIALIILFLAGSRSAYIALATQSVFLIINGLFKLSTSKTTVICLVLIMTSFVLPFIDAGDKYEIRGEIWKTAIYMPYDHVIDNKFSWTSLVFGRGFGNIEYELPRISKTMDNDIQYQYIDSAHNIFLDWWLQGGLVGLSLLLLLLFISLKNYIHHNQILEIVLMLGLLTAISFNPLSVVNLLAFWWLIGQGFKKHLN